MASVSAAKVRRSTHLFLELDDGHLIDLAALLRGELPTGPRTPQVLAHALVTGERHQLSPHALKVLLAIPGDRWVAVGDQGDAAQVEHLAKVGLLVSDADEPWLTTLRRRDETLSATAWDPAAAHYHYMSQWSRVDIRTAEGADVEFDEEALAVIRELVASYGPPPPAIKASSGGRMVSLPPPSSDGALQRVLRERRTTRAFDTASPMAAEDLSTVLRWVFGIHGYGRTLSGVPCIRRTSPSGGSLHPIEAYPIITAVKGVIPGIYHYDGSTHSLELLSELEAGEARRTATNLMCGQHYFGEAHVSVVLAARFYRSQWKYREHDRCYAGILMDAGHLSQTLYLVSADLGLGAFVTVAINGRDIEDTLGLDGFEEGAVAMVGCGPRSPGGSSLELQFQPNP